MNLYKLRGHDSVLYLELTSIQATLLHNLLCYLSAIQNCHWVSDRKGRWLKMTIDPARPSCDGPGGIVQIGLGHTKVAAFNIVQSVGLIVVLRP